MALMLSTKLPVAITGLFVGRILAELLAHFGWPLSANTSGQLATAAMLTALAYFFGLWLRRRWPAATIWPLFWLGLYVIAPTTDPRWLAAALFLTLLSFLIAQPVAQKLDETELGQRLFLALLIAIFLVAYLLTLAPDLLPADNGEFQLRATQLGVAHPPGFPLYTLAAYLFSRLPLGASPAWRVNLFGLLTALATLIVCYQICYQLWRSSLAAATGAAMLGVATTFWAQATMANIRSLTALFAALLVFTALSWYADRQQHQTGGKWPPLFVLFTVLAVGHHASLVFMVAVLALFMIWVAPGYWRQTRIWPRQLAALLLGLLPQSYLWWRGLVGAPGAPADLATLSGFFNHILARGFQGDLFHFLTWPDFADRLRVMVAVHLFQWPASLLIAAAAGWYLLFRQQRPVALLLLALSLTHTLITATYRAPQTVEYMLPAYLPWAISLAALPGLWPGQRRFLPAGHWQHKLWPALVASLLLLIGSQFSRLYPQYRQIRLDNDTRTYVQTLLAEAPADSLILADWHWTTPLWYATAIEKQRPDITVNYVFPTAEPYGDTWARRVTEAGNRPVITTHYDPAAFADLPPFQPLGEAFLFSAAPIDPGRRQDDAVQLGDDLRVIQPVAAEVIVAPGETFGIVVLARLDAEAVSTILFAHVVTSDGRLVAQQDILLQATTEWQASRLTLTPQLQSVPGDYQLILGAYEADGGAPLPTRDGDTRFAAGRIELVARSRPPLTRHPTYRPDPDNERILIGYDWDTSWANDPRLYLHWRVPDGYVTETPPLPNPTYDLPTWRGPWGLRLQRTLSPVDTSYVPFPAGIVWLGPLRSDGESVTPGDLLHLWGYWGSDRPVYRDYAVAMRLVGYVEDSRLWAWADLDNRFGIPAMGAIPTLKWVGGSTIYDTHRLSVAATASNNQQIGVILGLYDSMTNTPLSPLDDRFNPATPWYETSVAPSR